ncbi:hypothetical protein PG1513B_1489 [Bifidobacterium pseudolongum subsp. pseudolongum]|uniref:Uncharacterized protein n=2 Tax=Bifidobacterium pseudolongum TaxID=1694 RepID=A0A4Q5B3W3_9BIFI|nr:hypothetical protein PG2054B_1505 [Bifidobacterium pseudolongum subsp. pseudolongum]RYQ28834.1 hypothetical protein PG2019B_1463 [Bifidobacterium pseudolongum subsp. globosum]RYQ43689.1 hypothetical protein PG1791B_1516 [Bifidobacterium pseudolongum subsp. globosum]RYQ45596.1 hypothetical protein PG1780B_1463 [Bifidobacterium pseudolongum subsp. globosum]RYQ50311.1 hypothetical protein PG1612B_1532 [Bifidobacterium pseudolongum subsp. pseudolongum]
MGIDTPGFGQTASLDVSVLTSKLAVSKKVWRANGP